MALSGPDATAPLGAGAQANISLELDGPLALSKLKQEAQMPPLPLLDDVPVRLHAAHDQVQRAAPRRSLDGIDDIPLCAARPVVRRNADKHARLLVKKRRNMQRSRLHRPVFLRNPWRCMTRPHSSLPPAPQLRALARDAST